jgi:hypothetical protein
LGYQQGIIVNVTTIEDTKPILTEYNRPASGKLRRNSRVEKSALAIYLPKEKLRFEKDVTGRRGR